MVAGHSSLLYRCLETLCRMPNAVSRLTHTVTMQDPYYTVAWGVVMQLLKKG